MSTSTNELKTVWRISPMQWGAIAIVAATLGWVFQSGLNELFSRFEEDNYSHGSLIPLVVAYLIWQKKELLQLHPFNPSWMGFLAITAALCLFFIGELGAQWTIVQYSLVTIVLGAHLAVMGWHNLRKIIGPLLILYLAIPLPYYIDIILSGKLQLISSQLGVDIIRFFNIPVYIEGNVIDLGSYKLQVVEACSGLRYLYPLMSISLICAYMFQAPVWKRAIIFVSSAPITIFMNSFRIAVVGVLVDNYGVEMAEGFIHDFEGWVIFLVCMALLLLEIRLLSMVGSDSGKSWHDYFNVASDIPRITKDTKVKYHPFSIPLVACWILIIASANVVSYLNQREDIKPPRDSFMSFPMEISGGEWHGHATAINKGAVDILGLTDYLNADFVNSNQHSSINLYIGYHESQRKGVTPHSPRACIPGAGWEINQISNENMLMNDGSTVNYNRMIINKSGQKQLVYYWFQQRGRTIAKEYLMKWYLFYDAMTKNRTDGSLVRLITVVGYGEDIHDADSRMKEFAQDVFPLFKDYIPE